MSKIYSEKLKDPRWQKKRLEIFQRDEYTCQICGDTESTLAVHHYKYSGEPWEIDNKYLKTLCEDCHESEHLCIKQFKEILNDELSEYTSDINRSIAYLIHLIKETNRNVPVEVVIEILSDVILTDEYFIQKHVLDYYFKEIKKVK